MQKHSQHNKDERKHFFRKIYFLHFIRNGYERVTKGLLYERWVGDWTKTATYWPPALLAITALLSRSTGAAETWFSLLELQQLTPNSDLQLTRTSCGTGLYNCLTPTCFSERCICTQFNSSTLKVIPWYLWPDAPVIYTGAFLIWQLGLVGGQYVTRAEINTDALLLLN